MKIIKRDGRVVDYDRQKIAVAIEKANREVKGKEIASKEDIKNIIQHIEDLDKKRMLVEDIQDIIEMCRYYARHSVSFHCALPPFCDEMKKDTQRCLTAVQVVIDLGTVIAVHCSRGIKLLNCSSIASAFPSSNALQKSFKRFSSFLVVSLNHS